jgi:hypothetical protein
MARSTKRQVDWQMKNLDSGEVLLPPYPIAEEGLRIRIGGVYVDQPRFGFQNPITQWTAGVLRTITFGSVLFTNDSTESVLAEFSKFEKLAIQDKNLGRPPIVIFDHGNWMQEMVMVESIDPDVPPIRPDGQPRQVILNFTLRRYKPFSQKQIDPTKPKKESYFLVVRGVEKSYEAIARNFYGDPLLGDRLRKRHPDMPMEPTVGAKISIPAKSIIRQEIVAPAFHALSLTNSDALAVFEAILLRRNARTAVLF